MNFQAPAGSAEVNISHAHRSAMTILQQANMSSFGFFVPQDSHFGNSILPVLPRLDNSGVITSGVSGPAPSATPNVKTDNK